MYKLTSTNIDVDFDFTSDTPHFWDGFWSKNHGLGGSNNDPDAESKTLQMYHKLLWSKQLPNGEHMKLDAGVGSQYLTWKEFRFGSDSIVASFRHLKNQELLNQVAKSVPDYSAFVESFLRKAYTIGGSIIFPKRVGGVNQSRGCHPLIRDRWDLSLECIRRYYQNEDSPLRQTLETDKPFFDLFVDFKGYVDFFFLQDCVSEDYSSVHFRLGDGSFSSYPLPLTVPEYLDWIQKELEFVKKRNARIALAHTQPYKSL